jgi:hypothetical protein
VSQKLDLDILALSSFPSVHRLRFRDPFPIPTPAIGVCSTPTNIKKQKRKKYFKENCSQTRKTLDKYILIIYINQYNQTHLIYKNFINS